MSIKTLHLQNQVKLAIVGDLHEQFDSFNSIFNHITPSENLLLISVGDIYGKGAGSQYGDLIIDRLIESNALVVLGNHEHRMIRAAHSTKHLDYLKSLPQCIAIEYSNGSKITIVHGGVLPHTGWFDLANSVDILYTRYVDKSNRATKDSSCPPWHLRYDGRFGYVVSGHASQKDGVAKFYNFSCNLDSCCYATGKLTMQLFGCYGKEEKIIIQNGQR